MGDYEWRKQYENDDDNEDGDEDTSSWGHGAVKDGLIFLLDCSTSMLTKNENGESHFDLCMKCVKSVILNKIISSEKDLIGIVFYSTKKETNNDFKNTFVLQDLDQPGAPRVLEVERLLEDDNDDFENKYGSSETYSLSDAFWYCSQMFSKKSESINLGSKRLMLFTDNDNPHQNNPQLKRNAISRAKDLSDSGIDLELMHLVEKGKSFDVSAFYRECLFTDDDEITEMADPAEKFEELLTRVRSKDHKKRTTGRLMFSLGEGMDMGIGVYNLVRACQKPYPVKLYKKTNEEIKTITKTFLAETCELLMPQDLKKAAIYGGKKICFEKEELNDMKNFGPAGLKLMGFKPIKSLKRKFYIRPAQFIYPDETSVKGSTRVFTTLLQKCMEREVVAICRYIARKNTAPIFVALLPQKEELDDHKVQVAPPGFHVIFLPFADDIRSLKFDETPRANVEQIEKAKDLIQKLTFPFQSENFENPALQKHYANLEALALERDKPEDVVDLTLPPEGMEKRAQSAIKNFKDVVFPEGYDPNHGKRKAAGGGGAAKKVKVDDLNIDVEAEARAGKLGKLTVPVLKDFIQKQKIKPLGTKKADIIDAINDHFGL